MSEISGIGVKAIWFGSVISAVAKPYVKGDKTSGLSPAELKAFLAEETTKKITNIHEDNWNYEKTKPTRNGYKNKLKGTIYRKSTSDSGESKITLIVGKYDFELKAALEGGNASEDKWSAPSEFEPNEKTFVALTEDDVYIIYPKADIVAGGVTTDDAIGESVEVSALEPDIQIESEAHIRKSAVDAVTP